MSLPPVSSLCGPLAEDAPCGPDLEYDNAFQAMERAAETRPAQEMGEVRIEGSEPDWATVHGNAVDLAGRTRDLRVGVYLVQSALHVDGWEGMRDALAVLRALVDEYWDHVHPQLDPDDALDPTMRLNVLARLCDRESWLQRVRQAVLVELRGVGRISLRDIELARGRIPPRDGEEVPALATIEGVLLDVPADELRSRAEAVRTALEHWQAIDGSLTARLGAGAAADLSAFAETLQIIAGELEQALQQRGVGGDGVAGAPAGENRLAEAGGNGGMVEVRGSGPVGIDSPEDVIRALDLICAYYSRHEPSSPVPLLCQRAKGLVNKDFVEVLDDLIPDAVARAEEFRGRREQDG